MADRIPFPEVTLHTVREYVALVAVDTVGMIQAAARNVADESEIPELLTDSLLEAVENAVAASKRMQDDTTVQDQIEITDEMILQVRTIAAAALALLPFFRATADHLDRQRPRLVTLN